MTHSNLLTFWILLFYPVALVGFNIIPSSFQNRNQLLFAKNNIHEDNDNLLFSRHQFVSIISSSVIFIPGIANSFDGGVGGLGKTRPQTGVVFRDPEEAAEITQSNSGRVSYELLAPDQSPVLLSFECPWPLSKSSTGIECRDISGGFESSFVQVCELPKGTTSVDQIKPGVIIDNIFSQKGKFGMYGSPTDVRVKKIGSSTSDNNTAIYQASFTTLTPAMRESDRRAFISASIVGDGLFLLVTSSTSTRFTKLESSLKDVAISFSAIPAPVSNMNRRK